MERVLDTAAVENIVGYQKNDHRRLPRPLPVAREEVGGVRELESGDPVGNILAENADNNAQLLDVAVDENISNQANNNDHCENRWLSFEGIEPSECWRLGTDGSTISSLDD